MKKRIIIVEIVSMGISDQVNKTHEQENKKDDANVYLRRVVTCMHTHIHICMYNVRERLNLKWNIIWI